MFARPPSSSLETSSARELIPSARLTMKKETLRFHSFYAWVSSVSPVSIGMGRMSSLMSSLQRTFGPAKLR